MGAHMDVGHEDSWHIVDNKVDLKVDLVSLKLCKSAAPGDSLLTTGS